MNRIIQSQVEVYKISAESNNAIQERADNFKHLM